MGSERLKRRALAGLVAMAGVCFSDGARGTEEPIDYNAPKTQRSLVDYGRAAANVSAVNWTIWQIAWLRDKDWAPVTREILKANLDAGFTFDEDVFQTNFFGHPYHGGLQFNGARAAGLSFWESTLYVLAGSLAWELFAEREKPSLNDLAATTLGGIMLGEITYRLSSELLNDRTRGSGRLLRELAAAAVSPMRGFGRLTTGQAFRDGPAHLKHHPLRLDFKIGVDRVSLSVSEDDAPRTPTSLLMAADVEYGDLLPQHQASSFQPFDFFELYAALGLFDSSVSGAHVFASGLLYGFNTPLSNDPGSLLDNDVFGFAMNYEYVGTNFTTYSGVGLGPVNHLVMRLGAGRAVRLSVGIDGVPVLGATSTQVVDSERDYNFAAGISPWSGIRLQMGRLGELGLRMRHYLTTVIDGTAGNELIGSTRLAYEAKPLPGLGLGLAGTLVYRHGQYRDRESYSARQLSTQAYIQLTP